MLLLAFGLPELWETVDKVLRRTHFDIALDALHSLPQLWQNPFLFSPGVLTSCTLSSLWVGGVYQLEVPYRGHPGGENIVDENVPSLNNRNIFSLLT